LGLLTLVLQQLLDTLLLAHTLTQDSIFSVVVLLYEVRHLFVVVMDSWEQCLPYLGAVRDAISTYAQSTLDSGDFRVLSPPRGGYVGLAAFDVPLLYAADSSDQNTAALLVLLCGDRSRVAARLRGPLVDNLQMLINRVTARYTHLSTGKQRARAVHMELAALVDVRPVHIMREVCSDVAAAGDYLNRMIMLVDGGADAKEAHLERRLRVAAWAVPNLESLLLSFPSHEDIITGLRPLYNALSGSHAHVPGLSFVPALDSLMHNCEVVVAAELATLAGAQAAMNLAQKLRAMGGDKGKGSLVSSGPPDTSADGDASGVTPRMRASSYRFVVDPRSLESVLKSEAFAKASQLATPLFSQPPTGSRLHKVVQGTVGAEGCLYIAQVVLRHPALRSTDGFLNQLVGYLSLEARRLQAGFALVCDRKLKAAKHVQGFKWDAEPLRLWTVGESCKIHWQRDVIRPVQRAILNLSSSTFGEPQDFLLIEKDWLDFGNLVNRVALGVRCHAARPTSGTSFAKYYNLLTKYRDLLQQMPQKEQAAGWFFLATEMHAGWVESDCFRDAQLDQVQPDGACMQGFLPPESSTSGVIYRLRRAIKFVEKKRSILLASPGLYAENSAVAGAQGFANWAAVLKLVPKEMRDGAPHIGGVSKKRSRDDALVDDDDEDGKPTVGVPGASSKGVQSLRDGEFFKMPDGNFYGPLSAAVAYLKDELKKPAPSKVCGPALFSSKSKNFKCTMCLTPGDPRHKTVASKSHAIPSLPTGWMERFKHAALPNPNEGAAE